jgi:hypothetical protein
VHARTARGPALRCLGRGRKEASGGGGEQHDPSREPSRHVRLLDQPQYAECSPVIYDDEDPARCHARIASVEMHEL